MSKWKEVISGEFLDLVSGYAFKSKDFKEFPGENDLPVIKIKNVANGDVNFDKVVFHEVTEKLEKYILEKGDILIAMTGNHPHAMTQVVGDVSRYKLQGNALLNQRVGKLVAKDDNCLDFFYYYFKDEHNRNYLASQSSGSANQANISKGDILRLPMQIPEPFEQTAIASIFSSLDDKIDLLHRQNQTLEQMAETLFRQWYVEEAKYDWKFHQLDEFVEVRRGLSYKGAGLTDADNGTPMHNLNSVFEGGGYKEAGIKYYKGEFKERHKVYPGDVIITNTEQGHEHLLIGYPAIIPANFGDFGIFSQHIYSLEIKSKLSNFFLFHLLKTDEVHEQIAGATNGSTVNMLSKDGIEWVKFRMPPQELIDHFTKVANDQFRKQELNQTQIRTLTALRDTLLPKLMSGEIKIRV